MTPDEGTDDDAAAGETTDEGATADEEPDDTTADEETPRGRPIRTDSVTGWYVPADEGQTETRDGDASGSVARPAVVLVHGSGGPGGYERAYATRLAAAGYDVVCVSYFDAPGCPDALAHVPLERIHAAVAWLRARGRGGDASTVEREPRPTDDAHPRRPVGLIGFSRGAEAALLVAARFDGVDAVAAYAPSRYVFPAPTWMAGVDEEVAGWTYDGDPLAFLPVEPYAPDDQDGIDDALGTDTPDATARAIADASDSERAAAAIPVDRIDAPVVLVSGGADAAWPADEMAADVAATIREAGGSVTRCHYPDAGHAIRVPPRDTLSDETTGDGDEETGDEDEETGDGDEETGDEDEETGDEDEETGDGDEETGDEDEETGDGDAERHWLGGTRAANRRAAADAFETVRTVFDRSLRQ